MAIATLEDRLVAVSGRGPGYNLIRLIAATTVLLHHCMLATHDLRDPLFVFSHGFLHFGILAVIVFFAISGFLVTPGLQRGGLVAYGVNRTIRIFPALFTVVLASAFVLGPALTKLSWRRYIADPELYRYLKNALTLTSNYLPGLTGDDGMPIVVNGALWTLHFEVLSYIALAVLSVVGALRSRKAFAVVIAVTYSIYLMIAFAHPFASHLPSRFVTFIGLFVYFAAGSALLIFRDRVPYSAALAVTGMALTIATLPFGLGPVLLPICLPYAVVVLGLGPWLGHVPIKQDVSYGIYLIHTPVLVLLISVLGLPAQWALLAVMTLIATTLLAYLSRVLVEDPTLRYKKSISEWINARLAFMKPLERRALKSERSPVSAGKPR
ncbi:MAG: acyltransferase [Rhizobiales bacterium]|nr:acyltransferase [Hyphomicrobiales bacterium]